MGSDAATAPLSGCSPGGTASSPLSCWTPTTSPKGGPTACVAAGCSAGYAGGFWCAVPRVQGCGGQRELS